MTDRHPGPGKLLCAVLLACYGILAVTATGPHRHDLARDATAPAGDTGYALSDGRTDDAGGRPAGPGHCWLCAWERSPAQPAVVAAMTGSGPLAVAAATIVAESPAQNPLPADVSPRGPPPV